MSSNPASVTKKVPLVRKAVLNHLIKPTSLEKTQGPVSLVSDTLEIDYATQYAQPTTHGRMDVNFRVPN